MYVYSGIIDLIIRVIYVDIAFNYIIVLRSFICKAVTITVNPRHLPTNAHDPARRM